MKDNSGSPALPNTEAGGDSQEVLCSLSYRQTGSSPTAAPPPCEPKELNNQAQVAAARRGVCCCNTGSIDSCYSEGFWVVSIWKFQTSSQKSQGLENPSHACSFKNRIHANLHWEMSFLSGSWVPVSAQRSPNRHKPHDGQELVTLQFVYEALGQELEPWSWDTQTPSVLSKPESLGPGVEFRW